MLDLLKRRNINGVIFKAVDGAQLDLNQLKAKGEYDDEYAHKKFSRSLSLGEIGCALSHINLYKEIIRKNINMCVICEDDIRLVPGINEKLQIILKELPDDWELVYLWYKTKVIKRLSKNIVTFPSLNHIPGGTVCYLLRKSGAQKLLQEALPIHYPSDSLIGRSYRWGVKIYGTDPHLASLNLIFLSTIKNSKTSIRLIKRVLAYLSILKIKLVKINHLFFL
jgi:glycosyl transferase family 25